MSSERCDMCVESASKHTRKKTEKRRIESRQTHIGKYEELFETGLCIECNEDYLKEDIIEDCVLCPDCRQYCDLCKKYVLKNAFLASQIKCRNCINAGIVNTNIQKYGVSSYFKTEEYKNGRKVYTYDLLKTLIIDNDATFVRVIDIPLKKDSFVEIVCKCGNLDKGNFAIFKKTGKVRCHACINKQAFELQKQTMLRKYGVTNAQHCPELFAKLQNTSFKWKEYVMPSGRIVEIQGYEPFAIDYLLKKGYVEKDIVCGRGLNIPTIPYQFDSKYKKYYPDIFIPSENFIIEVKSGYTYKLHLQQNLAKRDACLSQGYKFEFLIFNKKGVKINK